MAKTPIFEDALYLIKENRTVEDAIITWQNQVIEIKTVKISDIRTATQARAPESFTMTVQHQIVHSSITQKESSFTSSSKLVPLIKYYYIGRNTTVLQTSLR